MLAQLKATLLFAALVAQQAAATSPRADGTIAGHVVDAATGKPVGAAIVNLLGPATPPADGRSVLTGGDGRFVFSKLQPGDFELSVVRPGYVEGVHGQRRPYGPGQKISIREGERHEAVVRLIARIPEPPDGPSAVWTATAEVTVDGRDVSVTLSAQPLLQHLRTYRLRWVPRDQTDHAAVQHRRLRHAQKQQRRALADRGRG